MPVHAIDPVCILVGLCTFGGARKMFRKNAKPAPDGGGF